MANIIRWTAPDAQQLESAISGYIAQGFVIANRTPTAVTLVKRKQFSIPILVIGLILCVVPLLIYLIYFAMLQDQVIELTLSSATPPLSTDGRWQWNGTAWTPISAPLPVPPPHTPAEHVGPATEPA